VRSLLALVLLAGCGGATLEVATAPTAPEKPPIAVPEPSPAPVAKPAPDHAKAARWALASIACFTNGLWDELQGTTSDRCRVLAVEALGAKSDDAAALAAVRGIDPNAVDGIVEAITAAGASDAQVAVLARAVADASREAMLARRAGTNLRKSGVKDAEIDAADPVLSARTALTKLLAIESPTAKVVALSLAADRLENARGLAPRAKIAAATPVFEVVFGVSRPTKSAAGSWLTYVSAAAKAAGHPAPEKGNTHDREQAAFAGVVTGLAERFESASNAAEGEAKTVAVAYAKRLRDVLAESQKKAQAKADAKTTADAAEKKAKPEK